MYRIGLFSTQFIKLGEQLTFDYQWKSNGDLANTDCFCGATKCRGLLELIKAPDEESDTTSATGINLGEQQVIGDTVATAFNTTVDSEQESKDDESSAVEDVGGDTNDYSPFHDLEEQWIFCSKYSMHVATWCLYLAPWDLATDFSEEDYRRLSSHQKRYVCGNKTDRLAYAEQHLVHQFDSENREPFANMVLELRDKAIQKLVNTVCEYAEYSSLVGTTVGGVSLEPSVDKILMHVLKENMQTYSIGRVHPDRCDLIICEAKKSLVRNIETT